MCLVLILIVGYSENMEDKQISFIQRLKYSADADLYIKCL